jgi:hypothetical protein
VQVSVEIFNHVDSLSQPIPPQGWAMSSTATDYGSIEFKEYSPRKNALPGKQFKTLYLCLSRRRLLFQLSEEWE